LQQFGTIKLDNWYPLVWRKPLISFDYDSWQAKMVALELANEVGRGIITLVFKKPSTATMISEELKIPLPTVIYHLARLETAGVVKTSHGYGKRWRDVKYYQGSFSKITFEIKEENKNGEQR
jgi:DNA-binding transcriptional ArsR family regulator